MLSSHAEPLSDGWVEKHRGAFPTLSESTSRFMGIETASFFAAKGQQQLRVKSAF
jgi:hypothetical protein